MQVDILSIPAKGQGANALLPKAGSQSTQFSDALAQSSQEQIGQIVSPPGQVGQAPSAMVPRVFVHALRGARADAVVQPSEGRTTTGELVPNIIQNLVYTPASVAGGKAEAKTSAKPIAFPTSSNIDGYLLPNSLIAIPEQDTGGSAGLPSLALDTKLFSEVPGAGYQVPEAPLTVSALQPEQNAATVAVRLIDIAAPATSSDAALMASSSRLLNAVGCSVPAGTSQPEQGSVILTRSSAGPVDSAARDDGSSSTDQNLTTGSASLSGVSFSAQNFFIAAADDSDSVHVTAPEMSSISKPLFGSGSGLHQLTAYAGSDSSREWASRGSVNFATQCGGAEDQQASLFASNNLAVNEASVSNLLPADAKPPQDGTPINADTSYSQPQPAFPTSPPPLTSIVSTGPAAADTLSASASGLGGDTAQPARLPSLSLADPGGRSSLVAPAAQTSKTGLAGTLHSFASRKTSSISTNTVRESTPALALRDLSDAAPVGIDGVASHDQPGGIALTNLKNSECNTRTIFSFSAAGPASSIGVDSSDIAPASDAISPAAADAAGRDQEPLAAISAALSADQTTSGSPRPGRSQGPPTAGSSVAPGVNNQSANILMVTPAATNGDPDTSAMPQKSGPTAELPPAHQMLDSTPAGVSAPAATGMVAHQVPDLGALQMQVGVHTSAFGNVEVHTVIEQTQVGISIHGDHELARWFNSEVGGLETGLKNQHLSLTGVDFSSDRSSMQSASSFQHGQPRQSFSQSPGSHSPSLQAASPGSESSTGPTLTQALPAQGPDLRVSILA